MPRIDAHQHFWDYDPVRHGWIDSSMTRIQRNFGPTGLKPLLDQHQIAGSVLVQVDQLAGENTYLLAHANAHDFIKGVVGWVDFFAENLDEQLSELRKHPKLKGFRYVLQSEPPEFMLQPGFRRGLGRLSRYGFTYDILIFPQHLTNAVLLVKQFPDQPFVVDHLAKPYIKAGDLDEWRKDMAALAALPNVYCKVSGMVTEADWNTWKPADLTPYLDVVVETFGTGRLMFGSDWPVCLCAATYEEVVAVVEDYFSAFSEEEKFALWGKNAVSFYGLE